MSGLDDVMAFFTAVFIVCLVSAGAYNLPWLWALAAFFGFAAIMTQIEIVG